jgi:hypothetical protein
LKCYETLRKIITERNLKLQIKPACVGLVNAAYMEQDLEIKGKNRAL